MYNHTNPDECADALLYSSEKPNIQALHDELSRSYLFGANVTELNLNDDLRYCRWNGQTSDGKKFSKNRDEDDPALPWEGSSDVRVRLIDRVINEQVSLWMNALKNAKLGVSGRTTEDSKYATAMGSLLEYVAAGRQKQDVRREAELWGQYTNQYGWSVMHIGWEQEMGSRETKFTLTDLVNVSVAAAQQDAESPLAQLSQYVLNKEQEDIAVAVGQTLMPEYDEKQVRKMVVDIRENGYTITHEETLIKNLPVITALKPYDEITFPPETIDLQKARIIFRRVYMTELEVRAMINTDGWDEKAVEEAVKTKGQFFWYRDPNIVPINRLNQDYRLRTNNLIEVCYAYYKQLGENGNPCVYYTVFSPNAGTETCFKHDKLGYAHGKYPFVVLRREHIRKAVYETRGITDILQTDQSELKAQHDSLRDRTAIETVPPIMVKRRGIGGVGRIGPAMQIPVTSPDDFKFMEPPRGTPTIAEFVIKQVEKSVSTYFGLNHEETPPALSQMVQQSSVDNWLTAWSEVYTMMLQLCLQYMDETELQRISGCEIPKGVDDIGAQYDFEVRFDVRNLYSDLVMEKLQSISQFVLPMDTGGVIDRSKLVQKAIEAISPDAAKDLIINPQSASQRLYRDVQTDIGMMMLGNEANYVENDPTAPTKMQYLQDIMSKNPKASQASQGDPVFQMLLENYVKNLQMSVSQQQNKQIGRIGVTPVAEKMQQMLQESQVNLNNAKTQQINQGQQGGAY
jgi:hypothetical protein